MKNLTLTLLLWGFAVLAVAQDDRSKRPSPPMKATGNAGPATVVIDYSAPAVKERTIWGELVPYGKVWRTGANEATTIEFSEDVEIEDEKLPAGKYALFTIPGEDEWVVIFNKVHNQWGAYDYDENEDALRIEVDAEEADDFYERLTFQIEKEEEDESNVMMMWENMMISFEVESEE